MPPLLAPLLRQRVVCIALLLSGIGLLAFQALGTTVYRCPFKLNTGLPCPGCGFTRGTLALLGGDWQAALAFHPFTPLVVPALLLLTAAAVLPEPQLTRIANTIEHIERRTGITLLLLLSFIGFGIWRILDLA